MKLIRKAGVVVVSSVALAGAFFAHSQSAQAMGKKPASPANGGACNADGTGPNTPNPIRKVVLKSVGTKAFNLPNGSRVDLSADLDTMLQTAVAGTGVYSPTDPASGTLDPCSTHLEIRAAVTTFQLNVFELGVSFGYTPAGETGTSTGVTGKSDVRIGTVGMDFSVYKCTGTDCSLVSASNASALTAGASLSVSIDFSTIKTGPDLVYNTKLGDILRSIMNDGAKRLANADSLGALTWNARVREYLPATGTLIFDAGADAHLKNGQTFVVYAAVPPTSGKCTPFSPVAYAHTIQVDTISSTAIVDKVLSSRGIQDGDLVLVRDTGGSAQ